MRDKYTVIAKWELRADSQEHAERIISTMLADLLGEVEGEYGFVGTMVEKGKDERL